MKTFLKSLAALILCLGCATAFAEDKTDIMMKDHIMMKDGKLMIMKEGKSMMMKHDETLTNGTMVKPDGTVKAKNEEPKMMKDGDMITMDGKMMTAGMPEKK